MTDKKSNAGVIVSIALSVVVLIGFIVYALAVPFLHTTNFWLAFVFGIIAILYLMVNAIVLMKKDGLKAKFMGLPIMNLAWIYFVLQIAFSCYMMYDDTMALGLIPFGPVLAVECFLVAIIYIFAVLAYFGSRTVEEIDTHIEQKVSCIADLKDEVSLMESRDKVLSRKLETLAENIRFSDPMSHSELAELETSIKDKVHILKDSLADVDKSIQLCDEIEKLLKERNLKTKNLKNKPDVRPTSSSTSDGLKAFGITFVVILIVAAAVIIALFVLTPASKYKAADELYSQKQLELSLLGFKELGTYKDSKQRVSNIEDELYGHSYEWACELYNLGQYDMAYIEFSNLGDYKDSQERAWDIWKLIESSKFVVEETVPEEVPEEMVDRQQEIVLALQDAFADSDIYVDPNTGTVIIPSTAIQFKDDSAELKPESVAALQNVVDIYIKVLLSDEFKDDIYQIVLEGYTNPTGDYDENLELSYQRASTVAMYFLNPENGLDESEIQDLQRLLSVNGRSWNNPVYIMDADGNPTDEIDVEATKRVEISFRLVGS